MNVTVSFRGHCIGALLSISPSQVFWDFPKYSPQGDRRRLHGARFHPVAGGESHAHLPSTCHIVWSVCNLPLPACVSVRLSVPKCRGHDLTQVAALSWISPSNGRAGDTTTGCWFAWPWRRGTSRGSGRPTVREVWLDWWVSRRRFTPLMTSVCLRLVGGVSGCSAVFNLI